MRARAAEGRRPFLSTLSLWRATVCRPCHAASATDFYPRSPCGERHFCHCIPAKELKFLSTLSLRRATKSVKHRNALLTISIHALLSESDCAAAPCPHGRCYFYPRSPCGERHTEIDLNGVADLFLSTLSLRRATAGAKATANATWNFYPRSPCGERRAYSLPSSTISTISIHALLAESDRRGLSLPCRRRYFYPRSPCGERPQISARALRSWAYFYPRSPCGERRGCTTTARIIPSFLSTLSLRRATGQICRSTSKQSRFLSTLSLRRATACGGVSSSHRRHFYPRSPCGERLDTAFTVTWLKPFLSTLSLRRATAKVHKTVGHFCAYETNFMGIASSC